MKPKDNTIVVKPGMAYPFISLIFIGVGIMIFYGLGEALPSDNPEAGELIRWALLLIPLVIGLFSILNFFLTKIQLEDEKISINKFPLKGKNYYWSDISYAKIILEAAAYPCEIYSEEERIVKVPRAYRGYEKLLDELSKRELLLEDDLYVEAKLLLAVEKVKLKDLFKKGKGNQQNFKRK